MGVNLPPIPPEVKPVAHLLKLADEHDDRNIVVAYWGKFSHMFPLEFYSIHCSHSTYVSMPSCLAYRARKEISRNGWFDWCPPGLVGENKKGESR